MKIEIAEPFILLLSYFRIFFNLALDKRGIA
jgi:hypothetical protein